MPIRKSSCTRKGGPPHDAAASRHVSAPPPPTKKAPYPPNDQSMTYCQDEVEVGSKTSVSGSKYEVTKSNVKKNSALSPVSAPQPPPPTPKETPYSQIDASITYCKDDVKVGSKIKVFGYKSELTKLNFDKKSGNALVLDPPTTPEKKKKSENHPITSPAYSPMEVAGEKSASCSKCDVLGINSGKHHQLRLFLCQNQPQRRENMLIRREKCLIGILK